MKSLIRNLAIFAIAISAYSAQAAVTRRSTIPIKDFFKNIVGMTEKDFRTTYGWDESKGILTKFVKEVGPNQFQLDLEALNLFKNSNPRTLAIFENKFWAYTVQDLVTRTSKLGRRGQPHFELRLFDPQREHEGDIKYLQADPNNSGAAFQIASTFFGPLEGGMYRYSSFLEDMLKAAVQGENASISAAGATIWRKYFMPTFNFLSKEPQRYNLLSKLNVTKESPDGGLYVDPSVISKYSFNRNDINNVMLGIHQDVYVTGGLSYENGQMEEVSLNESQRITQIFTAALDIGTLLRKKTPINTNIEDFAKMLLMASYAGTVRAAGMVGATRLYLTLMGGGAFRNNIDWIAQAINDAEVKNFIKQSGLNVALLYRPDKKREFPVRTVEGDITFLIGMMGVADEINGTQYASNPFIQELITRYVTTAYAYEQDKSLKTEYSKLALALNNSSTLRDIAQMDEKRFNAMFPKLGQKP